jgi:YVTN family beta-propeller protein
MVNHKKLYSIALVSVAMVFMLVSIANAATYAYIPNYYSNDVSVINTSTNNVTTNVSVGTDSIGTVVIQKLKPTISWSNPDDIVYGTTLSSTQLDANASVPGTFVYTPPSGTVLEVGSNQQLITTFTPNDIANYTTASTTVSINVLEPVVAYITNSGDKIISVINTTNNSIIATVPVGNYHIGVAVAPDATKVYVGNYYSKTISVISTANNTIAASVPVGNGPEGVAVTPDGTKLYVANIKDNTISVINTSSNTVTATVPVGIGPLGVAITSDGATGYVTNFGNNIVSIINTTTNTITATLPAGNWPYGVAVTPDGKKVYVPNCANSGTVSVINTSTNNVTATVPVGSYPEGVAVTPDGTRVYVANSGPYATPGTTVSVINTSTNNVIATVSGLSRPFGVAVTPDGTRVYVANQYSNNVSVINTTTNAVITTVSVGTAPVAFGKFITGNIQKTPTISWSNPTDIVYGIPLSNIQLDASASVPGTFVYTSSSGTVLEVGSNQQLTTTFTPTDHVNYTTASASVSINVINVARKTPTITWNNPTNIVYGTALSRTQLDASASDPTFGATVSGTFVYTPSLGIVLSVGSHQTLNATFTPNDIANYTTASKSVLINAIRATPIITWHPPANITYGTVLSSTQLDGTALNVVSGIKMPGTFVYNPLSGTVLSVGSHQTLHTTFTPNDIANYTIALATVSINVTKVTPTISWSNPANITYGTVLSNVQLDATSSVNGTFAYNPPSGTVLEMGSNQQLTTTFTPTDTVNYATATGSAYINVTQATPTISWSNPADITYRTPLSNVQLDATSSVNGTFAYNPPSGTVLGAGWKTLTATLKPTDSTNYTNAKDSVSIHVLKATPLISWSNPADITHGTSLSGIQLNATGSVDGLISYSPDSGIVLGPGWKTLTATLKPTDSTNYTNAKDSVSIHVLKATPTIS